MQHQVTNTRIAMNTICQADYFRIILFKL